MACDRQRACSAASQHAFTRADAASPNVLSSQLITARQHTDIATSDIGNLSVHPSLLANRKLPFKSNLESNRRIVVYSFNVNFLLIDEKQRCADSSKILRDRY